MWPAPSHQSSLDRASRLGPEPTQNMSAPKSATFCAHSGSCWCPTMQALVAPLQTWELWPTSFGLCLHLSEGRLQRNMQIARYMTCESTP